MTVETKVLPKMCRIKEAAELSGISQYRLREFCKQKKIVCIRTGNRFLINMDKLAEFLNEGDPDE